MEPFSKAHLFYGGDPRTIALIRLCGFLIIHPQIAIEHHVAFMLHGTSGCGKSTLCEWYAALVCGQAQSFDLSGLYSPFTRAQMYDTLLIMINEINKLKTEDCVTLVTRYTVACVTLVTRLKH